jgi:phosphohistidine phosphatase
MHLYLIRHAHALDSADDFARSLSARGRSQLKQVAEFLRDKPIPAPEEIWHSPLVRARETATSLADGLGWRAPLTEIPGLEPDRDPRGIVARIDETSCSVAIVGHEPHLSALGAILVKGSPWPPIFLMRKSGVLALERGGLDARWIVAWHLGPELFGKADD